MTGQLKCDVNNNKWNSADAEQKYQDVHTSDSSHVISRVANELKETGQRLLTAHMYT